MPLNINLPITTDPTKPVYSRDRLMYEPLIPRGNVYRSPIDISDYSRYVKNPIITGNLEADLDSLTETRASNQPYSHRLGNSLVKLGGKAIIHTAGGLASIPAIISSLAKGEGLQGYIDSELFRGIDDAEEWLNKAFPHYLTKAQQDYNTWQKLTRADSGFWGDTFLGGAAFLIGAVASDLILTRGAGLISRLAKSTAGLNKVVSKAATSATKSGLDLTAKAIGINDELAKKGFLNTLGSVGRLGISTLTSTGYESALEARHYKEHALQGLKEQFRQQNFRDPNEQELAALEQTANNASNTVFALNAVTVGINNALLLGKVLNTPFSKFLDDIELGKARRRIDIDNVTGVANVKPRTKFQKILDGIAVGSTAFREGLEEGLQAAYSEGLFEHALSKHDLNALDEIGVLSGIFNEGFAKAFGTQEGLEEVLVGLLLGLTGVPGLGVKGSIAQGIERYRGKDAYSQYLQQLASDFTNNPDTNLHKSANAMLQLYQVNKSRDIAVTLQDLFDIKNNDARLLFGWMNSRQSLGVLDESVKQIATTIENMSETEFREKYDKATNIGVDEAKKQVITSLNDAAQKYKKAYDLAQSNTGGEVMDMNTKMQTEALALLAYQTYDLDSREEAIANNLQKMLPDFNIDIDKALTKLQNKQKWLKGKITNTLNRQQRIDRELVALQEQLDKANEKYLNDKKKTDTPSTKTIDKLNSRIDALNKDKEKLVTEKLNDLNQAVEENKELQAELSKNGNATVDEYNNNINEYLQQVERAVVQQDKLEQAIKSIDRFNYNKFMTELADLTRIANKRVSLLTAWEYINSDIGKERFNASVNKFRSALIQKNKADLAYLASIDDFLVENGLKDKPSYKEALDITKALLDVQYQLDLESKYVITKFTVYEAKHNTDSSKNIKVAVTQHKDGSIRIYKIDDNYNRVDSELDVENFKQQYAEFETVIIDHSSIINNYKTNIQALEVGSDEYINAVQQLVKYISASDVISIEDNKVFTVLEAGVVQELDTTESLFKALSDHIDNKVEQTYNYAKFIQSLVGSEYSSVEQVEEFTEDKDNIISKYQRKLIDKKNKDYSTIKAMLFKDYSDEMLDNLLKNKFELQVEATTQAGLDTDDTFAVYQSRYFYNLGRNFKEQEEATKPPTSTTTPPDEEDKKEDTTSKDVGGADLTRTKKGKEGEFRPLTPSVEVYDVDGKSLEGEGKKVTNSGDASKGKITNSQTVDTDSNIKNFIELALSFYSKSDIIKAVKEVRAVFEGKEMKLGFDVDVNNKIDEYELTTHSQTHGSRRDGKSYFIHLTLNGVRIGRILDGNRFIDTKTKQPLDFSKLEDLQKYNPSLTKEDVAQFKQSQEQLNELTDAIISNSNQDVNELLQNVGFAPILLDNLNPFVLLEDNKLQYYINKFDNILTLDYSYDINNYGIVVEGRKIQPVIENNKLVAIRYLDEDNKVITEKDKDVLNEFKEVISEIYNNRINRRNETNNTILIQYGDKIRSVDIKSTGITDEMYSLYNESFVDNFNDKTVKLLNNDNQIKINVERGFEDNTEVEVQEDGDVRTLQVLQTNVKFTTSKDEKGNYNIRLFRTSSTSAGSKVLRSAFIVYKINKDSAGSFTLTTPDNKTFKLDTKRLAQQVKDFINQDLSTNQEARLKDINSLVLSEKSKELGTIDSTNIPITKLGTVAFKNNESDSEYYPLMLPIEIATDINDPDNNKYTSEIPNVTFSELQPAPKLDRPFSILDNLTEKVPVGGEIVEEVTDEIEKIVITEENYNRWSNVRDKSDYAAFVNQVRFTLAIFNQVPDKSKITPESVEEILATTKAFSNKDIRDKVIPLIINKYKQIQPTESKDAKANIEAKKADIEKRRKAELKKIYPIKESDNSLEDLIDTLKKYGINKEFEFISSVLQNSNIQVSFDGKHAGGLPNIASMDTGIINRKLSNILTINKTRFDKLSKKEKIEVIAHEFVHGLIKLKLNEKGDLKGTSFYNGLNSIFKEVKDFYYSGENQTNKSNFEFLRKNFTNQELNDLGGKIRYIESSIEEFATLGLTDSVVSKFLKLLQGTGETKQENLWTKLSRLVSEFLGISNTKFNELLNFISLELDTNINYVDKINAKYDAELAKLESKEKPPVETKEETKEERSSNITGAEDVPFNIQPLDNTIFNQLGIDINTLKQSGEVYYTDEDGNLCANKGMTFNRFTAGSKWSIVKDLKNMPTHEQGGIDLQFTDSGVKFTSNNAEILADKGLLLSKNIY